MNTKIQIFFPFVFRCWFDQNKSIKNTKLNLASLTFLDFEVMFIRLQNNTASKHLKTANVKIKRLMHQRLYSRCSAVVRWECFMKCSAVVLWEWTLLRDVSISYLVLSCNVHTRVSYLVILYTLTPGSVTLFMLTPGSVTFYVLTPGSVILFYLIHAHTGFSYLVHAHTRVSYLVHAHTRVTPCG